MRVTLSLFRRYADMLQRPIQADVFQLLGYNPQTKRFSDGLMCDTNGNIIRQLVDFLTQRGMLYDEATRFVDKNFFRYDYHSHVTQPIDDPKSILMALKQHGIKLAICTSDSRAGNASMLDDLNLHNVIDISLCGDDMEMKPKPDPSNIDVICKKLGVRVSDSVMVGDAQRDIDMGCDAGVMASVGVYSGVCQQFSGADVVLPSIKYVLEFVIPAEEMADKMTLLEKKM